MANEEQFVAAIELIADKLGVAATEIFFNLCQCTDSIRHNINT